MSSVDWPHVDNGSSEIKGKGHFVALFLFVVASLISGKAQCAVCTHGVNQNPITAEVIDTLLQVSYVSTGRPARISTRIKKIRNLSHISGKTLNPCQLGKKCLLPSLRQNTIKTSVKFFFVSLAI